MIATLIFVNGGAWPSDDGAAPAFVATASDDERRRDPRRASTPA